MRASTPEPRDPNRSLSRQSGLDRRSFLKALGVTGLAAATPGISLAANGGGHRPPDEAELPCLVRSLPREYSYRAEVRGQLPAALRGTLYRNGPGIFERDGHRKRCLLDGDGMVQAFRFEGDGVHYQNRFVTTRKYLEEQAAERFLHQSWTTVAPGGWIANLGIGDFEASAGVNAVAWGDSLYALEDASWPYRLDPSSLATLEEDRFGAADAIFGAHPKIDPKRQEWIHTGIGVMSKKLHVTIVDRKGRLVSHRRFDVDRGGYVHDCFVSDRYIVVVMSPVGFAPFGLLSGRNSVAGCFRWRGEQSNQVYVIERAGGDRLIRIDAPAMWLWHSTNTRDRGREIVMDFVGYDEPDHFIGDDPFFWAIMDGRFVAAKHAGKVRRHVIDPEAGTLREAVVHEGSCEYPTTNPLHQCGEYRYGYYAGSKDLSRGLFHDRVMRIDMSSGQSSEFFLGEGRYCGESVFVPKPGVRYEPLAEREPGWLLTLVYDLTMERSSLAIFEAEAVADGPIAEVMLEHATPFSFHGSWLAS
jgi:all-trans-8'-apo-beta-carotenal 15,15'-oxygenase